jgi:hypothetical protein
MKAKLKFDAAGLKKWAFEHGEKVALGIMVLVFLSFTYFAIRREVLDDTKQPEKLQAIAGDVKNKIDSSKWSADHEKVALVDFDARAKRDAVEAKSFAMDTPFSRPLAEPKVKREDPQLFNAEELHVAAGFGPFALKTDAPAGAAPGGQARARGPAKVGARDGNGFHPANISRLQPQPWAVVTALVPVEKQRKEYERVFERAVVEDKSRDVPHYAGPVVERAEVSDADPKKFDWKPLSDPTVFEARWEGTQPEVIAAQFVEASLTSPLGPLVGSDWGESVAHPKIPVLWAPVAPPPTTEAPPEAAGADTPAGDKPAEGNVPITRRGAKPAEAPQMKTAPATASAAPVVYNLLRVFDYSVEPNKRYRYRVKLGFENPNFGVAIRHLKNPEAPRPQMRTTDQWSEPSEVVTVPNGNGVLAGGVKPQPRNSDPQKAKLLLTAIDKENGIEAAIEQEFERGAVANVMGRTVKARDPRNEQIVEREGIDFKSDAIVLDIYGGRALTKKRDSLLASPVDVLLMDASGHLIVRSELDDLQMYQHRRLPDDAEVSSPDKPNTVPGPDPAKPRSKSRK